MSKDGQKVAAERALDLLVYAPVGVALYLRDTVPTFLHLFVSRGRSEVGQRRQQAEDQVSQAKSLGEFAVGFGGPKLREQVEKGIAIARQGAEAVLRGVGEGSVPAPQSPTSTKTREDAPAARPPESQTVEPSPAESPAATTLVIPEYDELSASQVVERLEGLQSAELDAVRAYEEAHRARRTILFKIEQLTS